MSPSGMEPSPLGNPIICCPQCGWPIPPIARAAQKTEALVRKSRPAFDPEAEPFPQDLPDTIRMDKPDPDDDYSLI